MSADKPGKNGKDAYYTTAGPPVQYPEALPSTYDPNQQQSYPQYYNYDGAASAQPGNAYPAPGLYANSPPPPPQQEQQQMGYADGLPPTVPQQRFQQQPPPSQTWDGNQNNAAGNHVMYEAPPNPQTTAPAAPAYYDYTVPQSFQDVTKFDAQGKWATSLCAAPCADPCFCISAFFCPCCCTYLQRRKLLVEDWSRYRCCAGICGQCLCLSSNCGKCAPFCMVMETLFCLACAVHGNRFMVMQHYGLQTDCCDCVIMWSACILQIIGAILGSDFIQSAADCLYAIVLSCMLTQNEYQMKQIPYPAPSTMT